MKSAAGAAVPSALTQKSNRRSDRRKKQARREKARKFTNVLGDASSQEYRAAVWLDTLEGVTEGTMEQEEDEYDEMEELNDSREKRNKRRKTSTKKAGVIPKRFKSRSLASILVEEANQEYGVSREFINAEAKLPPNQQLPPRRFCPVTGLFGIYTDPKSGIPYANLKALEQIQERAPPWMNLSGAAAYLEATKSLSHES